MKITWSYTETENKDVPVNTTNFDTGKAIATHQVTYTYDPINANLSTKSFCAYKNHPWIDPIRAKALEKFKKEWLIELGLDPVAWRVEEDGTVEAVGKVKTQSAVDKWLKPNEKNLLSPAEIEEI